MRKWILPFIPILAQLGLDVSGIENWTLAVALLCAAGALAVWAIATSGPVKHRVARLFRSRQEPVVPPKPDLTFEIDHQESSILVWPRAERHELQVQLRGRFLNALKSPTHLLGFNVALREQTVASRFSPRSPLGEELAHQVLAEPAMTPIDLEAGIPLQARSASGFYWLISTIAMSNDLVGQLSERHVVTVGLHTIDAKTLVLVSVPVDWNEAKRRALKPTKDALLSRIAQRKTATPSSSFNVPTEHTIRIKYSSRQVVEIANAPGNHNDTLNLDNAATLVELGPCDHNTIHMILTDASPLTVERPQANVPYQTRPGVWTEFPAAGSDGIDIEGFRSIDATGAKEYVFTRWGAGRSHVVVVGTRKFRVSLDAVNDRSTPGHKRVEYAFGISEE